MTIYPAIDLIDGKVVRLTQGDYSQKTDYSDNPASIAKLFEKDGAEYIHIVDLDGAKAGHPVNAETMKAIKASVNIPIQVGGGIRSVEPAREALKYADRIIIGTVAISQPDILREMLGEFSPDKIVVSVDYKDGAPAINGWLENGDVSTEYLLQRLKQNGVKTVIVTDVSKDGLLDGPNIDLMKQWKQSGFEVICAGGVSSLDDIRELKSDGIDGAIIGKALYEAKIDLKEAIDAGR